MVFTLANVGLPGTTGFIGEFLSLIGTFKVNTWVATLAALGLITSACYALWLYLKVIFGKLEKPSLARILDLSPREIVTFAAADPYDSVRHLSQASSRHVGRLCDGIDGELSAQPRTQFGAPSRERPSDWR
jgi:hypothetical protein